MTKREGRRLPSYSDEPSHAPLPEHVTHVSNKTVQRTQENYENARRNATHPTRKQVPAMAKRSSVDEVKPHPLQWKAAVQAAGGDTSRLEVKREEDGNVTVIVHNHPIKKGKRT